MLWAYEAHEAYEAYEAYEPNFREDVVKSFHRLLLPPLRRSPSLEEGGLGFSPVKACGLAVDWIYGLCGRPYDPSRALSKGCCYNVGDERARNARPPTLFKPSFFHPKDLPHRGRGTVRRRWKEFSGGGRRSSPSLLCRTSFYFPTHTRHTRHMKHTRNRS